MDTNFFAGSAMLPVAVVAAVPAANGEYRRRRHACLYGSFQLSTVAAAEWGAPLV